MKNDIFLHNSYCCDLQEETSADDQPRRESMSLQASPAVGYSGQEGYNTYGGGNQLHPGDASYEFEVRT